MRAGTGACARRGLPVPARATGPIPGQFGLVGMRRRRSGGMTLPGGGACMATVRGWEGVTGPLPAALGERLAPGFGRGRRHGAPEGCVPAAGAGRPGCVLGRLTRFQAPAAAVLSRLRRAGGSIPAPAAGCAWARGVRAHGRSAGGPRGCCGTCDRHRPHASLLSQASVRLPAYSDAAQGRHGAESRGRKSHRATGLWRLPEESREPRASSTPGAARTPLPRPCRSAAGRAQGVDRPTVQRRGHGPLQDGISRLHHPRM